MSDYQQKVGPRNGADNTDLELRGDRTGSQVVTDAHGRYHEGAVRGVVFTLDSDSVTLAAANATKGALATLKFINGFWNPPNSGKVCSILRATVATVSGTPAGPYFYNFIPNMSTVSSASTGTVRSMFLGSAAASIVRPQVNVALAVLPADTTTTGIQLGTLGGPSAVAATGVISSVAEEVAGAIIVPPGTLFGITCVGAGTSHVVQSTLVWEEVNP